MEDRYEIRGKIGQGGLGSVYRAFDTRMNREVAIKRIGGSNEDQQLQEEATRQLMKEAGALASLQHPHIVTVYDVGSDEDGPYVVMELLSGKTLDELVEKAPLTWNDFRELALQTQEALIAAQELHLVHRDIKPGNIMLSWLPSGKFQVKIVDFGLAKLTPKPSLQTLDQADSVFGSIFFMAPEQFERGQLDARVDMYALGCVYYHALTGTYPFDGDHGPQVMAAHLQHTVTPLQEVRANIPLWACDWIMWHINRMPADRPESARESLQVFLRNDQTPNPPLSTGTVAPPQQIAGRPRLITPGSGLQPAKTQPIRPTSAVPPMTKTTGSIKTHTSPQPLLPPDGFKPSVHTSPQSLRAPEPEIEHAPAGPARKYIVPGTVPPPVSIYQKKKQKTGGGKKVVMAALVAILAIAAAFIGLKMSGEKKAMKELEQLLLIADKPDANELPISVAKLNILLQAVINPELAPQRPEILKAIRLAKSEDGTSLDERIVDFTTKRPMSFEVRERLFTVIGMRKNPAAAPALIDFARYSTDPKAAAAALGAVRLLAGDEDFAPLLELIVLATDEQVSGAAEQAAGDVMDRAKDRATLAAQVTRAAQEAANDQIRLRLIRLQTRSLGQ